MPADLLGDAADETLEQTLGGGDSLANVFSLGGRGFKMGPSALILGGARQRTITTGGAASSGGTSGAGGGGGLVGGTRPRSRRGMFE